MREIDNSEVSKELVNLLDEKNPIDKVNPGAVIFAKDVSKLTRFYEQIFSMVIKIKDRDKVILESEYFSLVIHAIPIDVSKNIEISVPPKVRENTPVKLYLPVISIAEARVKANELGGKVNPKDSEWGAANFMACDGFDPEGNVVQFRQESF